MSAPLYSWTESGGKAGRKGTAEWRPYTLGGHVGCLYDNYGYTIGRDLWAADLCTQGQLGSVAERSKALV